MQFINDAVIALLYVGIGFLGGAGHWFKKRYIDDTTTTTFMEYLYTDVKYTKRSMVVITFACVNLSFTHSTGYYISLHDFMTILVAGYTSDSVFNKVRS